MSLSASKRSLGPTGYCLLAPRLVAARRCSMTRAIKSSLAISSCNVSSSITGSEGKCFIKAPANNPSVELFSPDSSWCRGTLPGPQEGERLFKINPLIFVKVASLMELKPTIASVQSFPDSAPTIRTTTRGLPMSATSRTGSRGTPIPNSTSGQTGTASNR